MAYQDIVCAGWVGTDEITHTCGQHLGTKETLHPGVTHSICGACLQAQREDGMSYLEILSERREKVRLLWGQACCWDDVHPSSPMVVFSDDNPYSADYNEAYTKWMEYYRPSVED